MKKINILLIAIFILISTTTYAQLAMGKWRTHLAYNNVEQIAQTENKIFAVSEGSLFSVDKEDFGLEFYSKVSGLNDNNISRIEYDIASKQLLIVYANGNIDLLSSGGVINIIDLYIKQMSTSKKINNISFYGDFAYLSMDFGILVVNMKKREIADTYFIGANATEVKVINTIINNGKIYAASTSTIYTSNANQPNLVNYEYWNTMSGLPGSGNIQMLTTFDGKLLLQRNGKLYLQNSDQAWTSILTDETVSYLSISGNNLFILNSSNQLYLVDKQLNKTLLEGMGAVSDTEYDLSAKTCWFAGNDQGVISYNMTTATPEIQKYKPAGPTVNVPWDMTFGGQKLFVVQGGRWSSQYQKPGIVMIYDNGEWTNISENQISSVTGVPPLDFMNVAVDPADNKHFFVTSYGTGLYEFKNNELFKWHNTTNSTLETIIETLPNIYTRLDGAVFDPEGNLFLTNSYVKGAVQILKTDGTWSKITHSDLYKPTLGKLLISNQYPNQKWVVSVRYTPGIVVYDDNGTLTNLSDDKTVFLSAFKDPDTGEAIVPSNYFTLAQDKNGVIWVGTDQGPLLFYNTSRVFDAGFNCSRVKIPRNDGTNQADYLLVNERIKAIAIDGANRKWLGTESSGAFLMSENGQEVIHHFNSSNSPLLSNNIMSIAINPVTGEVYFGTDRGIVSYQSDAAESSGVYDNVYAYPNPVREGFNGVITITGLVENTQVKITDINGNLVCSTVSNGSLATWNGKDLHGRKVNTGVYLVICANEDGTQSTITKILVIN
jgi:ligand-binding sensor domain-containing protein